jgi:hypothetical protein
MNSHFIQTKKVLYYFTVAIILIATVFVSGVLTTASAQADSGDGQYLLAQTSPYDSLNKAADVAKLKRSESLGTQIGGILKGVLGLLGILLLLMLIFGGFTWMTAGGNSEKVQQANKIINNAIIGLIVIFLSYAMTNFWITQIKNAATNSTTSGNATTTP